MWIFLTVVVIVVVYLTVVFRKMRKKGRQRISDLNALKVIYSTHTSGLPVPSNILTHIYACEDKLVLETKNSHHEIPYERIIRYGAVTRRQVIEIEKSVIGRAAIGGLLLGNVGAIVGGMSGIGNKKQIKDRNYLIINYINRDGHVSAISFDCKVFRTELYVSELTEVLTEFRRQRGLPDPDEVTNEDSPIL